MKNHPPLKNGVKTFYAKDRKAWRRWLEKNHKKMKNVWLIMYRKKSETPSVYQEEAVEEALCFGWIDSLRNKKDEESFYQYFSTRKPGSKWSKINKARVRKLIKQGLMRKAGREMIRIAKENKTWTTQ
jgi:uncharacterized protein YdeI (YjbR/CyaY-like superfamily)